MHGACARASAKKINKLPLKFFDKVTVGDVLSRITNDVDTISSALNSSITTLVQAVVQFVGVTIIMFATSGRLALTAIGSSILGFVLMFFIVSRSRKYFRQQQQNLGDMNGHVEEMYSGHNIVRAYGATAQSKKEFDRINDNLYNSAWKSQFFSGMLMPLMGFVGNLGYVAVCIVGATLTMSGAIRFGTVIAFISYVKLFTNPLSQILSGCQQPHVGRRGRRKGVRLPRRGGNARRQRLYRAHRPCSRQGRV